MDNPRDRLSIFWERIKVLNVPEIQLLKVSHSQPLLLGSLCRFRTFVISGLRGGDGRAGGPWVDRLPPDFRGDLLLPFPGLHLVFAHLDGPLDAVELDVEAAGVAYGRA